MHELFLHGLPIWQVQSSVSAYLPFTLTLPGKKQGEILICPIIQQPEHEEK